MTNFSHSKLGCFENCCLQYKFKYIDKIKVKFEDTAETFLGSYAHLTLEKLYKDLKFEKLNSLKELITYFNKQFKENWNSTIKINRKEYTSENYRKMGVRFITDYYERYKPFDSGKVLGLETTDFLELNSDYKFHVRIDRLMDMGKGVYEVHDYKTNNRLPKQEYLDKDRQLAMYSYWVKKQFKDFKKVRLVWHFLAFDKELDSFRTSSELEDLKKEVLNSIKKIENCKKFPSNVTALCDWCLFQDMCPEFGHVKKVEKLEVNEFLKDSGVKLVNSYSSVKKEINELEEKLDKIKEALIAFAKKEKVSTIVGSDVKASVKSYPKLSFPKKGSSDQEEFFKAVKKIGLWDKLATVDVYTLTKMINNGEIDDELMKLLDGFVVKKDMDVVRVGKK